MRQPILELTVPGEPVPKGRPRVTVRGNHPHAYTPAATATAENLIKVLASQAMAGRSPFDGAVKLTVRAFRSKGLPKTSGKRHDALNGSLRPTTRPDWDNYGKLVSDALNGVAWIDDSQVVSATVEKCFSDSPRLEILVEEY